MRSPGKVLLGCGRLLTKLALVAIVISASAVCSRQSIASVDTVQFSTTPVLYPAFGPTISDYVIQTTGTTAIQVTVTNSDPADTTTTVSVDSQWPITGGFTTYVTLDQGQGFIITVMQGTASRSYYVRTLPSGFPTWGTQQLGTPQAEYYVVVPVPATGIGLPNRYISIYDTNAVPIWWTIPESPHRPLDAKLLPNGDILWTESDTTSAIRALKAEHRRLDGSIVNDSIATLGYQLDAHEALQLDNGNYVVIGTYSKCCYNLSSHGGPANAPIRDNLIQEVTSNGTLVWTWLATDHIGLDEVQQQWWTSILSTGSPYDVFHFNSVEVDDAHNVMTSFRHLNAIYKFTNPTSQTNPGNIIWKLGGSLSTMEPGTLLTVVGDPAFNLGGGFGGQHYARWFDAGDGQLYVTLHDNGNNRGRPPRGVMYRINETLRTATLIEDVRDIVSPNMSAPCCGSAAKLPTGNWVMSWGSNPLVMELTPAGNRVFVLTFSNYSYRVDSVMPGRVTRAQLRAGMNAQYPRIIPTPTPIPTPSPTLTPSPTPTPAHINVSGAVASCSSSIGVPIASVSLNVTGDMTTSTLSDSGGNYWFSSFAAGGSYTVTPDKSRLNPGAATVNTVDLVAVQRHFLGIARFPPGCQFTASDVTGDGVANTADVIAMQRFVLGLVNGIANTGKYQFTPSSRSYPTLMADQTTQNYETLILGDVVSASYP